MFWQKIVIYRSYIYFDKRVETRNIRQKNISFGYKTQKTFIYYITFLLEDGTQLNYE